MSTQLHASVDLSTLAIGQKDQSDLQSIRTWWSAKSLPLPVKDHRCADGRQSLYCVAARHPALHRPVNYSCTSVLSGKLCTAMRASVLVQVTWHHLASELKELDADRTRIKQEINANGFGSEVKLNGPRVWTSSHEDRGMDSETRALTLALNGNDTFQPPTRFIPEGVSGAQWLQSWVDPNAQLGKKFVPLVRTELQPSRT
jgi:hypothetical protein